MSRRKKPFAFFLWHRRLGLGVLLLVFILSITGIMLNHTEDFKLDETIIESDFILDWYDINPRGAAVNYTTKNHWISQWNQQLFFNGYSHHSEKENLQGVIAINNMIAIAFETFVLLLDNDGEIIEQVPTDMPLSIIKIAAYKNKILLLDNQNNTYLSDSIFTRWSAKQLQSSSWAKPSTLPAEKTKILKQAFRGHSLNLERVILDLHSGRLFHPVWGRYIMDASAIIMILLGISGIWVWWSRKLKMRKKKHYRKHH